MLEKLNEFLLSVKSDQKLQEYDEATTKQTIILRLLSILGWNIFSPSEVIPEYSVQSRRVDYALQYRNITIFLEVKKPKEDLENHQEQLLDYAFRQGAKLAILTNGITWWFYLPMSEGSWSARKFYTIDISEQETESINSRFIDFLAKENIANGSSLKAAKEIHEGRLKKNKILESLPDAWNRIISDNDSLIIDMLSDATERICGFQPERKDVVQFLKNNRDRIILDTAYDIQEQQLIEQKRNLIASSTKHKGLAKHIPSRGGGTIRIKLDQEIVVASSIPKLYLKVLKIVVDSGLIKRMSIPWGVGTKRYLIVQGKNPIHPHGRAFFQPIEYKDYYMETHVNRASGVKYLGEFCKALGYNYEVLEV